MNIVRTLGIFMALAALSFVLGFFVLARLIPGASKPAMATAIPAGTQSGVEQDTAQPRPAAPLIQPSRQKTPASAGDSSRQPRVAVAPGPSLDPVNDPPAAAKPSGVQKPRKVDDSTTASSAPAKDNGDTSDDEAPASRVKPRVDRTETAAVHPKRRRHPAVKKADPTPAAEGDDTTVTRNASGGDDGQDEPVAKPRRPRHARVAAADDTAAASSDEGDTEKPARHRRSVAADPESASAAVYHVHLGAFHSRDAAAHEVERARGKGFATQVVPVTHNGRTLYRVQAGAFRERERAETVKQNLQDASLDASVSEQRR